MSASVHAPPPPGEHVDLLNHPAPAPVNHDERTNTGSYNGEDDDEDEYIAGEEYYDDEEFDDEYDEQEDERRRRLRRYNPDYAEDDEYDEDDDDKPRDFFGRRKYKCCNAMVHCCSNCCRNFFIPPQCEFRRWWYVQPTPLLLPCRYCFDLDRLVLIPYVLGCD
jgi:hypothetical protein